MEAWQAVTGASSAGGSTTGSGQVLLPQRSCAAVLYFCCDDDAETETRKRNVKNVRKIVEKIILKERPGTMSRYSLSNLGNVPLEAVYIVEYTW